MKIVKLLGRNSGTIPYSWNFRSGTNGGSNVTTSTRTEESH